MKDFFLVFAFLFFSIFTTNAQSALGCVSTDTGLIYPDKISGKIYDITNPTQPNQGDFCDPQPAGSCQMRVSFQCRACTGPDKNGWFYQEGFRYRFYECPIDDYIPYITLIAGGFGFILIKKKGIYFPA